MVKQTKKNRKSKSMRKSRKVRKSKSMRKSRKLRKSKTMRKSRTLRKSKSMRKSRYRTHREGGGFLGFGNNYNSNQKIMLGLIRKENIKLDKIIEESNKTLMRTIPDFIGIIAKADQSIRRASAYKEILRNVKYSIENNINLLMPPNVNVVDKNDYSNRLADVNIVFMKVLKIEEIYCILNVEPVKKDRKKNEYNKLDYKCKQSESVYKIYESLFIKAPSSVFVDLSTKESPIMNDNSGNNGKEEEEEEEEEGNDVGPAAAVEVAAAADDDYMEVADEDDAADAAAGYMEVGSSDN